MDSLCRLILVTVAVFTAGAVLVERMHFLVIGLPHICVAGPRTFIGHFVTGVSLIDVITNLD